MALNHLKAKYFNAKHLSASHFGGITDITVVMPRRRGTGGRLRLKKRQTIAEYLSDNEPIIPKQKVVIRKHDDTEEILLILSIL